MRNFISVTLIVGAALSAATAYAQIDPLKQAGPSAKAQVKPGEKQGALNAYQPAPNDSKSRVAPKPGEAQGFNPQPEPPIKLPGQMPSAPANAKQ